jgi:predicted membrane protein
MKTKVFIGLEAVLLVLALGHFITNEGFLWVLFLIIVGVVLYNRTRSDLFKVMAIAFGMLLLIFGLGNLWLWLMLLLPFAYSKLVGWDNPRTGALGYQQAASPENARILRGISDDIIDLDNVVPTEEPYKLTKFAGTTKIVVPIDSALHLTILSANVKVDLQGQESQVVMQEKNFLTRGFTQSPKKVRVQIKQAFGSVKVVRI